MKQSKAFEKEEKMLKSYNEEFYTSLKSTRFLTNPLPPEMKLFYQFEQNENASVSTTTGQLLSSYDDLIKTDQGISQNIFDLDKAFADLTKQLDIVDKKIAKQFEPEIRRLFKALEDYVAQQNEEYYKLNKEISLLEKEKEEIQISIYNALGYLNKLEKQVGIKSKTYTYIYDQTLSENEMGSKFDIEKVDL